MQVHEETSSGRGFVHDDDVVGEVENDDSDGEVRLVEVDESDVELDSVIEGSKGMYPGIMEVLRKVRSAVLKAGVPLILVYNGVKILCVGGAVAYGVGDTISEKIVATSLAVGSVIVFSNSLQVLVGGKIVILVKNAVKRALRKRHERKKLKDS